MTDLATDQATYRVRHRMDDRAIRPAMLMAALGLATLVAVPAAARDRKADQPKRSATPYIEIGQVVTADLGTGDVLTYSTLAAGVDASIQTKRIEAQISYRYEHRFYYDNGGGEDDVHTGLARVAAKLVPGLSIEGGALATRTRVDNRGSAPGVLVGRTDNIAQVYSVYAGPSFGTHVGPIGLSASYRLGYTKAEASQNTGVDPTQPRLDQFDTSRSQVAQASVNLKAGSVLPIGVTVSGAWERDDARQLDQTYEGKYARADILFPFVGTGIALVAGGGYEKITVSQRDPLLDSGGQPVVDNNGRFVTDPASARRIAYNFDGIYYDAGVVWKPSARTQLEARVGKRYGSTSITGSFNFQPSRKMALRVGVYDGIQTFGRQVQDAVASLPTNFTNNGDPLGNQFNGCVFGSEGGAAGNCLTGALQSISTAAYRARGIDAIVAFNYGRFNFGAGAGYANREYVAPDLGSGFTVNGVVDESYYAQAFMAYAISRNTTFDATAFANYYQSNLASAQGVIGGGVTGSLTHNFGRIGARASAGYYRYSQDGSTAVSSVQALLGARYQF